MDKTKAIIITILAALLFGIPIYIGKSQVHILVIYSTSADSAQANQINRGMEIYRNNNPEFANKIIIENYYMDMEQPVRQKCEIYLTEMRNTENLIRDRKPNILILSGDIAQRLIGIRLIRPPLSKEDDLIRNNARWFAKNGNCNNREIKNKLINEMAPITLDAQPQIIFMGVFNDVQEYGYYKSVNVSGIFEHLYIPSVKEALQDLYRSIPESDGKPANVIIVGDQSSLSNEDIQRMRPGLSASPFDVPLKWGGIKDASSWEKWKEIILSANRNNSMIFIAGYGGLAGEQTRENIVKWTEACAKYAVVGNSESFITDGGMLSVSISDQEQGATALELARQILENNYRSDNINFMEPKQFTIGMNKNLLDKRHINLPIIYESFSRESDNYRDFEYSYSAVCQ